jgi:hypothetical protein
MRRLRGLQLAVLALSPVLWGQSDRFSIASPKGKSCDGTQWVSHSITSCVRTCVMLPGHPDLHELL